MRVTTGILCLIALAGCSPRAADFDVLVKGGTVYDGTLAQGTVRSIGIRGDRIVSVDAADDATATRVIDASGLLVVPGFIDPHTHAEAHFSDDGSPNLNYLAQGVTTVFVGNDGRGVTDVENTIARWERAGLGSNVAILSGHGRIRSEVMGLADRPANAEELAAMSAMLERELRAGSFGLSTGLFYAPGSFADSSEVVALARVAHRYGGIYDTHLRSESSYGDGLLAAIDEAIAIGRDTGIRVHISHIKALGQSVWGRSEDIIERVEAARSEGINVTANQYPWRASGTRISNALIPRWAMADSRERMIERLSDAELGPQIRAEMAANLDTRGGPDAMLVTAADSEFVGKTLADIAVLLETDPITAAIDVVLGGDPSIASFVMNPDDIRSLAAQDWVMTGSDGSSGHPRLYATYPKAWQDLVIGGGMSMPRFVQRSSSQVADTFNVCNRGYIRPDYIADIAIIDPESFVANASYASPTILSTGVRHLFINGAIVIDNNNYNGSLEGSVLRRTECLD